MSWLYLQTWLWYLIAFTVGVLLAWLVLVWPQRRRLALARGVAQPGVDHDMWAARPGRGPASGRSLFEPGTARGRAPRTALLDPATDRLPLDPPTMELAVEPPADDTATAPCPIIDPDPSTADDPGPEPTSDEQASASDQPDTAADPATPAAPESAPSDAPDADPAATADRFPRSGQPGPDGAAPSDEFTVKAHADSMLCHTPDSPRFADTAADVWFRTVADAEAAGFTSWTRE